MTSRCGSLSVPGTFITCQTSWSPLSPPLLIRGIVARFRLAGGGTPGTRGCTSEARGGRRGGARPPPGHVASPLRVA